MIRNGLAGPVVRAYLVRVSPQTGALPSNPLPRNHSMPLRLLLALVLALVSCSAAAAPQCSAEAQAQAHRLLAFHFGEDTGVSIEPEVREMPSLRNPADPRQKLAVLEVWGHVYKGRYRMRFLYHRMQDDCVLIGQEILEYARL